MPDDRRFSEGDLERDLKDLEGRIEYPPTPDVAQTVRLRLDEERGRETRRSWRLPPLLVPRWTAVAAALVLISVIALSPTLRTTLSGFLAPGDQSSSEVGRSAARPESGGTQNRHEQKSGVAPQAAGSSSGTAGEEATGCPPPAIEARPARGAAGTKFRLGGHGFSSGCDGNAPAPGVRIYFLQSGKTWKLETLDADRDLEIKTRLLVPRDARPGPATVQVTTRYGEAVEDHFFVLR